MRFHVDFDTGPTISVWVAPDNPTEIPSIVIEATGHEPLEVEAFIFRQDILDAGLHANGMVGFNIDESQLPGLASSELVEIYDPTTKLCLYRRFSPQENIEKKLFLFDPSVLPQNKILNNVNVHFAIRHNFIERHSYETIITLIHNYISKSIFLQGRPQFARYYGGLRTMDFTVAALLRNPFEELAERLLFLKLIARSPASTLLTNFASGLEPALDFARDLQLEDRGKLQAAFRTITQPQRQALGNPLTRMLACSLDERVDRRHVSVALENLAQLDAVGTRSKFAEFSQILRDLMGKDIVGSAEIESFQATPSLTETLCRVSSVVDLLEHDLALYSFAEEAVETGISEKL